MAGRRRGEDGPIPFRTGRFFAVGSAWYFACREGLDRGPFSSRDDAREALKEHLRNLGAVEEQLTKIS